MLRADQNETFPLIAALVDDRTGAFVSGESVYFDIRNAADDSVLSPTISGVLIESSVKEGIYRGTVSIPDDGVYICYTSCSGFLTGTEEIIINPENIYSLVKQNKNYNLSVEDVVRTNVSGTYSQTVRNVPYGKTDYIENRIKGDNAVDWNGTVASGIVYAHYKSTADTLPYMMGSEF